MQPPHKKPQIWTSFPRLESRRLVLREMIPKQDEPDLGNFWGNSEVCRYTDFYFPSEEQIHNVLLSLRMRFQLYEGIRWGITIKSKNIIIGTIGFNTWETQRSSTAEIGYDLHPDYWRQGIMTEAILRVLDYGFSQMQIHRIEAQTDPLNTASRKLLENCGFLYEGTLRDNAFFKNAFHTSSLYAILKTDR